MFSMQITHDFEANNFSIKIKNVFFTQPRERLKLLYVFKIVIVHRKIPT